MATAYLPQHDPAPALRDSLLAARRERYVYDAAVLPPFGLYHELPSAEVFTAGRFTDRLSSSLGVPANFAAVKLASLVDRLDELQDYEDLFRLFDPPAVIQHWGKDSMFAEQRVAGIECRLLRRIDRLPANLRLSAAEFAAITGRPLDRSAAEGKLHLADYALLDGIAAGETDGRARHLYAPLALFCWIDEPGSEDMRRETPRRGQLVPVAIQLDQRPTADNLYTPRDGLDWQMARIAVQAAEHSLCMMGHHLAIVHLAMEAFALATARQLAEVHPLAALLRPHLRHMMAQDELSRRRLINPGGYIERLLAPTREGSLEIAARSFKQWNFTTWALPSDLAARGVDDPHTLPHYPFRDDGLLVWSAIAGFVAAYLDRCYTSEAELHADVELRAWLDELADPARGNLPGLPAWPLTRAALAELVTNVIFTNGPYHSSLTYRQWEYATYIPNYPMALYSPLPGRGLHERDPAAAERALLALLPAQKQSLAQLELIKLLTAYQLDQLGHYGDDDPLLASPAEVRELVTQFQERLVSIEGEVQRRNEGREFPYHGMLPSRLANRASV
jgi:arachidonate 15-lipoxygenase